MDTKAKIKVVKRGEKLPSVKKDREQKTATTAQTAREMVSTVSGWVAEFKQKRSEETKDALEKLFAQTGGATGCTNC